MVLAHGSSLMESDPLTPRPLLHVPRLPPAAPLICYEAIFPGTVVQGAELLNQIR